MTVTATPIFPQTLTVTPQTFVFADGTTAKTAYTAGAQGSKLEAMYITNTDTSAYTVNVWLKQSAVSYLLATVNIPLSSGNTTSAPTVDLFTLSGNLGVVLNRDPNGNPYLYISSGTTVTIAPTGAVTNSAGKQLTFLTIGEDF